MSKKKRRSIPIFQHPIIETHCHLDYLDEVELTETLSRSSEVGIEKIITIAVSPENLHKVIGLSEADSRIWGTQGIHPHEAEQWNSDVEAIVRKNLTHPRVLAVGEIGLDYFYDHADREIQREVFRKQLTLASELKLPVVIHTREADDDTQKILGEFSGQLPAGGVIHSFTSSLELAEYCLRQGFHIGFNGIATFNTAENVRDVVRITPLERILLETDAPYLTPVPYRGRPNAPYYLPFVAEKIAELKEIEIEELLRIAYRNSQQVFFAGVA